MTDSLLNNWIAQLTRLPRGFKRWLLILVDVLALSFALYSSSVLSLNSFTLDLLKAMSPTILLLPLLGVWLFIRLGLYRAVLRFSSGRLYVSVAFGVSLMAIALEALVLSHGETAPTSLAVIFGLTSFVYISGSRATYQWLYLRAISKSKINAKRTLIYGAGSAGSQLYQSLERDRKYSVYGFIDSDKKLIGSTLYGEPVYGASEDLSHIIQRDGIDLIVLAMPSMARSHRKLLVEGLLDLGVEIRSIPSMAELMEGQSITAVTEIDVNDLLGRESVKPNDFLIHESISGKVVAVTGAGGSIGSELCRQAIKLGAQKLILVELSEYALYAIDKELEIINAELESKIPVVAVLGSARNQKLLEQVFSQHSVQTVYHAAAYKHVPLVESNPLAGICNNVFGTRSAALAADACRVDRFILISTDKAVRPTNVMGATKRLSELVLQSLSEKAEHTIFGMVRFGNVLGSSGSVIPLFKKQIASGGPVTVTHPDINRFFMTIPEATSLVIQAGSLAKGGDVFLLDMGEPVRIADLAEKMIRLSGARLKSADNPQGDIEIIYSGLRPGEKLFEELLIDADSIPTVHSAIFSAQEQSISIEKLEEVLATLIESMRNDDVSAAKNALASVVSGYFPMQEKVVAMKVV